MVFYLRWIFWATVVLLFGAFLHYSLPQWDVVRIADTYEQRVNPGNNSLFWARGDVGSNTNAQGRDVFFIQTIQPNGAPMVFRNEDRPLYFKFDTSNLQAEAADAKSTAENPKWVAVRHYGWRAEVISIYPNALKIKPVDGPDARVPVVFDCGSGWDYHGCLGNRGPLAAVQTPLYFPHLGQNGRHN